MDKKIKADKPLEVRITKVQNGFRVCSYIEDTKTDYEYVYDKLNKALKEVPSLFDVLKAESPNMTKEDLKAEKEAINNKEDY